MKEFCKVVLSSNGTQVVAMIEEDEQHVFSVVVRTPYPQVDENCSIEFSGTLSECEAYLFAFSSEEADQVLHDHHLTVAEHQELVTDGLLNGMMQQQARVEEMLQAARLEQLEASRRAERYRKHLQSFDSVL